MNQLHTLLTSVYEQAMHGVAAPTQSWWQRFLQQPLPERQTKIVLQEGVVWVRDQIKNGQCAPILRFTRHGESSAQWSVQWEHYGEFLYTIIDAKDNLYIGSKIERMHEIPGMVRQLNEARVVLAQADQPFELQP